MKLKTITLSQSQHFDRDFHALTSWGFEKFILNTPSNKIEEYISKTYPEYQLFMYDGSNDNDDLVGFCVTIPWNWDGTLSDLPLGYDAAIERHFDPNRSTFNTLSGRAIVVREDLRGRGLSYLILDAAKKLAASDPRIAHFIVPVRPTLKSNYPFVPIDEYLSWKTSDGSSFDPWIRVHLKSGGRIIRTAYESMVIEGTIEQWTDWANGKQSFDKDGPHVLPGALVPIEIDHARNVGTYIEPNVWIEHPLSRPVVSSE